MTWPDSPTEGRLGDGRFATATDRPETIDALCQVIKTRTAEGHAVYPQGGATALDFGGTPRLPGVAIDTRALGRVIDYPAADMTITVEAGITAEALQTVLAGQNQRLLIDVPQGDRATVGAVFATNTCGPRRLGAGRPRDQIIGVSFVNAAGALVKGGGRVVKNVAGYDFPRLLTGSMGTLGIIAQLTLKVRPRPEASALVWVPLKDSDKIGSVLERLNTSDTRPMALEVLNSSAARHVGGSIGLPADVGSLVVGFEDNAPSVAWQIERLRSELGQAGVVSLEGVEAEPLWKELIEFQAEALGPIGFVASVKPSSVAGFVAGLDSALWAVQAHAGNGIVRGHWLVDQGLENVAAEIDGLRKFAEGDAGHLTLPRCPADWKDRLRVWGDPRPDWALAERIKAAFDPRGLMNPGRFVGTI